MTTEVHPLPTEFDALAAAHRDRIRLHCYRMLGSIHDAEDATQEALIGAWKALPTFEGRSSLSTWLHGIATNVCLTMLRKAKRTGEILGARADDGTLAGEVEWLTPIPDQLIPVSQPAAPDVAVESAEATRLAFVSAVQLLPPKQRATLILKDVLGWSSTEIAEALDVTAASVNSALQRARDSLRIRRASADTDAETQSVVDEWVRRWHAGDMSGLADMLAQDARMAMPPDPFLFTGPREIVEFIESAGFSLDAGPARLLPTRLNGGPALAGYLPDSAGRYGVYGLMTFETDAGSITRITAFPDVELAETLGLPLTLS